MFCPFTENTKNNKETVDSNKTVLITKLTRLTYIWHNWHGQISGTHFLILLLKKNLLLKILRIQKNVCFQELIPRYLDQDKW